MRKRNLIFAHKNYGFPSADLHKTQHYLQSTCTEFFQNRTKFQTLNEILWASPLNVDKFHLPSQGCYDFRCADVRNVSDSSSASTDVHQIWPEM